MPKKTTKYIKRILNCIPSRDTEKDWGFEDAESAGLAAAALSFALPENIDLREAWYDIGDQLDTGSCVGWGVCDAVLRWHLVKCSQIAQEDHLSVRYLWMAAKETDQFINRPSTFIENDGTSLKAALDVARKYGLVKEELVPFIKGRLYQGTANSFYSIASQLRIKGYYNLGRSLYAWRNWLANNGPIATRLNVDSTWDNATETGGKLDVYHPETGRGGHAVALVGFTPQYFIVRNSWGTEWGDGGYAYAYNDYALAAFTEAYGVAV